ncbi:FMN-linked oxidoreductase [Pseudovirgaria hyperparasitica]|uniref:FMN-linked oxidoreductase n=1 Tax=Pseudovirgaria hyperparasitica TaxID=470096 RepID=A0A6A6W2R0_9PEZI|nr:FMN-linked oxidoreductase [Pseudovirgaria hyperparasitica]KAF2756845.1 FMN-linked oxidoreductase [Pseudovirgaria hyperparasitica]
MSSLSSPLTLPSGLVLPNRLSKAAMAEDLAESGAHPGTALNTVYNKWATGNWGMLLTGNVMVDSSHRGSPSDVALPSSIATSSPSAPSDRATALALWTAWANAIQSNGTPAVMQVNHPGRQCPRNLRKGAALAPSAIPLQLGTGLFARFISWVVFGSPREMSKDDIQHVVAEFAETARLASDAGFKGVELHAAHGYLLAQFLSERSNQRTDEYGGSAVNRARLLREVVAAVRSAVPKEFAVGIKLNSVDFQAKSGLSDVLAQIGSIVDAGGVDFLEISGGTYENPEMAGPEYSDKPSESEKSALKQSPTTQLPVSSRTAAREAFFIDFARDVRAAYPSLPLMVTGGFRTRAGMAAALESNACDIVGVGRPACVTPELPREIVFNEGVGDEKAVLPMKEVRVPWVAQMLVRWVGKGVGAGIMTKAYQDSIKALVKAA